ncbi:drug/metabolite transporter (DMT)-like permease [Microbacterium sp. SORGH_AS 505]|nr:drug/metabolite transporter (DMT)-like permease [Microbacterium sp. SORGH_AS_0505]
MWSSLVVPVPALALSFVIDGPAAIGAGLAAIGPQAVISTLYTAGLCTLFAYAVFNGLLGRNPSAAVVPWILLAPVVAMASAALLRGEAPSVGEVVGGAVLVAGVLVSGIRRRQRVSPAVELMGVPTRLSA